MRESASIRVSLATRDAVRDLAGRDGLTLDELLARLLKAERQRRMELALAAEPATEDDPWIDAGLTTANEYVGEAQTAPS